MYKHTQKYLFSWMLLAGFLISLSATTLAQKREGFNASGWFSPNSSEITLEWYYFYEEGENLPEFYTIYLAEEVGADGSFLIEDAFPIAEFGNDELKTLIDTTMTNFGFDGNVLYAQWSGGYEFESEEVYLKIVAEVDGEAYESNSVRLITKNFNPKRIFFESEFGRYAFLNKEYKYDANAIYDVGEADEGIEYSIIEEDWYYNGDNKKPENIEIDSETGELTWIPTEAGIYVIGIQARLVNDPDIVSQQVTSVQVFNCSEETKLKVNIIDQNGEPANGFINLVYTEQDRYNSHYGKQIEIIDGVAESIVKAGDFKILYFGWEYEFEQWYDEAFTFEEAKVLSLECGDQKEITMNVRTDISWEDRYALEFTNDQRKARTIIDELFEFDLDAVYNTDVTKPYQIEYNLQFAPEGVEIDKSTGEISWIPTEKGIYNINVRARVADEPFIFNDFYLTVVVGTCAEPAVVEGTVSYDDSEEMPYGVAFVISAENMNGGKYGFGHEHYLELIEGKFRAELDAGEYFFGVQTERGQLVFYKDAINIENAESVEVECGDTREIEIVVGSQNYEFATVSGKTTDDDGNPISAMVYFQGRRMTAWGWEEVNSKTVRSNEDGVYELKLPQEFEYTAYARADYSTSPLYWEQTYNPNEAKIIELTGDLENIDFAFESLESKYNQEISGIITNAEGQLVSNVAIIALNMNDVDAAGNQFGISTLSSDGSFELNVAEGGNVLFALPQTRDYSPGFYVEDAFATFAWEEATVLNVDENFDKQINIILESMDSIPKGNARVRGVIKQLNSNKKVSGANIILKRNGKPVMHGNSHSDGSFGMNNIASGEYSVVVNKMGYQTFESAIDLENNNTLDIEIPLVPDGVASVDYGIDAETTIAPNPASDEIKLMLTEPVQNANIHLVRIDGQVILSRKFSGNEITFDLRNYSQGAYILKLETEKGNKALPFVINK